jgi:hypothetical protein
MALGAAAAGAVAAAAGAPAAGWAVALSTSALTMRPWGPEPLIRPRSRPLSFAMRRASGEAKTREPSAAAAAAGLGVAAAAAAGAGVAAGVSSTGAAAGALADVLLMSSALSPSSRRTAMGALTFTPSAPSSTSILPITPSSTASNSIVALSVSISARMSPAETVSPSLTSHLESVPSSMVGLSAGIRISVGILGVSLRVVPRQAAGSSVIWS